MTRSSPASFVSQNTSRLERHHLYGNSRDLTSVVPERDHILQRSLSWGIRWGDSNEVSEELSLSKGLQW